MSAFRTSVVSALLFACPEKPSVERWQQAAGGFQEALMGVAGSSATDVFAVGADTGSGPLIVHFDGTSFTRIETSLHGNLWWVHSFAPGHVMMSGSNSLILERKEGRLIRHQTPGLARQTVFGLWGRAPNDVYAVGSNTSGRGGFIWHYDGSRWSPEALPDDLPLRAGELSGLFKVWGNASGDVYAVGSDGIILRRSVATPWKRVPSPTDETLFTVVGTPDELLAVGGGRTATLVHGPASALATTSVPEVAILQGLFSRGSITVATGEGGAVFERSPAGLWNRIQTGLNPVESLHAVWVDPSGGIWAVGGRVLSDLKNGVLFHFGVPVEPFVAPEPPAPPEPQCPHADIDPVPNTSIARRWNEQILAAIRRDLPRPTVHARNLYHLSAAMWDAWSAFEPAAKQVLTQERATLVSENDRAEAISYAAFRVLDQRYRNAIGGKVSAQCFRALMQKLGYDPDDMNTAGISARALGNRIAQQILTASANDGANEANDYKDTTGFRSVNSPLSVETATRSPAADIDQWQPLDLAVAATQNGIPVSAGVQGYIGAQWKDVTPFALTRQNDSDLYIDPGAPPKITPDTIQWAVDIIRKSSRLEAQPNEVIDISPGKLGNNTLGTNDGSGHARNPSTGMPYQSQIVPLGDFARVLAEFWADGPKSETPPGHWNALANQASDHPRFTRMWKGSGAPLSALEWDVRLYLALNGALHDAAIAAWQVKRRFTCSRPITIIRSAAALGQSSDPSAGASFHPKGLPLIPGLIELITRESAQPGQRHAHLRPFMGEVAIRAWRGEPGNSVSQVGGIEWIRGVEWVPYQRRSFVTPAFPGFVSGHSTFSRAAAEVLTSATGTAFVPGGLGEASITSNVGLTFERGPSVPLKLQWATWFDAADQAGQSRLWGGIHIEPDDFVGRRMGAAIGGAAFQKAATFFP